jgi:hypothetical protein
MFAVRAIKSARQSSFAAQIAAVRALPCAAMKNVRQSACRAPPAHGKGALSRSELRVK